MGLGYVIVKHPTCFVLRSICPHCTMITLGSLYALLDSNLDLCLKNQLVLLKIQNQRQTQQKRQAQEKSYKIRSRSFEFKISETVYRRLLAKTTQQGIIAKLDQKYTDAVLKMRATRSRIALRCWRSNIASFPTSHHSLPDLVPTIQECSPSRDYLIVQKHHWFFLTPQGSRPLKVCDFYPLSLKFPHPATFFAYLNFAFIGRRTCDQPQHFGCLRWGTGCSSVAYIFRHPLG